jgi:hypothetical protein
LSGNRDFSTSAGGKVKARYKNAVILNAQGMPSLLSNTDESSEKPAPPTPPPPYVIPVARLRRLRKYELGRVAAAGKIKAAPTPQTTPSRMKRPTNEVVTKLAVRGPRKHKTVPASATGPVRE